MGNAISVQNLLSKQDKKLDRNSIYVKMVFFTKLNSICRSNLETCERERTEYGCSLIEKIEYCKNKIKKYNRELYLLNLDLQIVTDINKLKHNIIEIRARKFVMKCLRKMLSETFFENDFVTEKWSKYFYLEILNQSDFYFRKAKKIVIIKDITRSKKMLKDTKKMFLKLDKYMENESSELRINFFSSLKLCFESDLITSTIKETCFDQGWFFDEKITAEKIHSLKSQLQTEREYAATEDAIIEYNGLIYALKLFKRLIFRNFSENDFVSEWKYVNFGYHLCDMSDCYIQNTEEIL